MENIKVDFTNPDEVRGYIKGLKLCRFMISLLSLTAPIDKALEELEEKYPR